MNRTGFVYFMSNTYNNVLYVGVTNNLVRRVAEHKAKINKGFTYKYNCDKLVYFEAYDLVIDAIAREKQIKNWKREWKNELVNKKNPKWNDLSESIGVNEECIQSIKEHYKETAGQARSDVRTDCDSELDLESLKKIPSKEKLNKNE
ncbi:MAG: GIY-YIG nuclease family protein [Paludibacter sp.]|nr:GIY-YIG nuclease family protein [Paludibacter sp.]